MNGTTAMVPYEPKQLPSGEPEVVEGEWMSAEEAERERKRRREEYERQFSDEPIPHERVYRVDWDESEDVEKAREEARKQAAEDAYQEELRRRAGEPKSDQEKLHEDLDRMWAEAGERQKQERMRKREEEAEKEKMKFERERLEALKQAQKLERQKMGFESREMRRRESGKVLQGIMKAATLGGPIRMHERTAMLYGASGMRHLVAPTQRPRPTLDKLREATYPSGGMRGLTSGGGLRQATQPSMGMRELTMPPRARGAYGGSRSFADLLTPRTQRLQNLTMLGGIGSTPIARAKTQQTNDMVYRRMRALTMPDMVKLGQTEQVAYAEIKGNHDKDTREHVIEELAKLGISRMEASRAIDSLLRQGLVKKGASFRGEPVLEVAS